MLVFRIVQKRDAQKPDAHDVKNMDQDRAAQNKEQRLFPPAFESDHKSREKYDDAQCVATFDHSRNISAVKDEHYRRLEKVWFDFGAVSERVGEPFRLAGYKLGEIVDLESSCVETVEIGLVNQRQAHVHCKKLEQENKKRPVLLKSFQLFF